MRDYHNKAVYRTPVQSDTPLVRWLCTVAILAVFVINYLWR